MTPKKKGGIIVFDNRILRGHIVSACGSIKEFAKRFGLTENMMQLKVSNKSGWTRDDIVKATAILGINDPAEVVRTFFSVESWENTAK